MFDSVRTRLTLWYAGVLALGLIAFAVLLYYAAAKISYARQDELLRSTAETVASAYLQELEEEQSVAKANEVVLAQMVFPNRFVEVIDPNGQVVASSSNLTGRQLTMPASSLSEAHELGSSSASVTDLRVAVVPLSNDRAKRLGFAIVAEPLSVVDEGLRRLRIYSLAAVPLILLFASLGGYFLARKSLLPIAVMHDQTQRITAAKLSARLDVAHPRDEVGRLATTINELLTRLEAAFQEQKRFIADASHELRTPLAVLRGETEVALQQDRTTAEYQDSLGLIKEEAERLSRIVEDLFLLARQPVDAPSMVRESVRLNDLVVECGRAAQVLATQKGLRLSVHGARSVITMNGDDEMLKRMVLNLLDNSVKYTPAGGEITIALELQNGDAKIVVTDTGIGIPVDAQMRIFDRFYRVDKARSRAVGGAGLGLSIAQWIVVGHGGSLTVESVPGQGSSFTVALPVQK
jgi:heavy metal sensor kinase